MLLAQYYLWSFGREWEWKVGLPVQTVDWAEGRRAVLVSLRFLRGQEWMESLPLVLVLPWAEIR